MQRALFTGLTLAIAGVCAGAPLRAEAAPSMTDVLRATYAVRELTEVSLASDGASVAWQERFYDPQQLLHSPRYDAVYVRRVEGGKIVRVTAGMTAAYYDEEDPEFSPDGRSIAFLSDARSNGQQAAQADKDSHQVYVGLEGRHQLWLEQQLLEPEAIQGVLL